MKKKLLSLALALCMALTLFPVSAFAADSDFTIQNGVLTRYNGSGGDVTIPSGVTMIGDNAFQECQSLTSVTIPSGVISIEASAFEGCSSLTSVTIPSSVTSIGYCAFLGCESLASVTIPSGVTSIGGFAFGDCYSLTSVTIPSGVTRIGASAFISCSSLTSVTIPSSVTSIDRYAFDGAALTDVYYNGTKEQWEAISVSKRDNKVLFSATIHYSNAAPEKKTKFSDVPAEAYYEDAVKWAVEKNITSGTSATTFSPDQTCTTAQILTFLWRAKGSPEPKSEGSFSDVSSSDYYYKAALWAKEKGLVSGNTFNGNTPCTRSATVTYLWTLVNQPVLGSLYEFEFTDVSENDDYADAVVWAVIEGVTSGTSATTFSPDSICTRGQIVTFLFKAMGK